MEPAKTIIELCGGFQAVSDMTGRSLTRVHRWTYPRDRGGTDGMIPSDVSALLMSEARKRGLPLSPHHFFPGAIENPSAAPAAPQPPSE